MAAEAALAAEKERLRKGEPKQPEPQTEGGETLATYSTRFLQGTHGLKKSTVRFYRDHLENHIVPLLGNRPIGEMRRRDVKALIADLHAKKLRPTTIAGIVRTLSTILSEAVDDETLAAGARSVSVGIDRTTVPMEEERPADTPPDTRRKRRTTPYVSAVPPRACVACNALASRRIGQGPPCAAG